MKKFIDAFNKAVDHNSKNDKKKSFNITYKKLNGRTVKRKIDPRNIRNGMVIAWDHKRKAVRSFKIDKVKSMEKSAFWKGFEKQAALSDHFAHAAEIGGLGILAAPSIQALRGKKMNEHKTHKYELAGLGVLAAPSIAHYAEPLLSKVKSALK